MQLFNKLFGTVDYGESAQGSTPPDTQDALCMLAHLSTPDAVVQLHRSIRQELAGGKQVFAQLKHEAEQLRLEGNDFYNANEFEKAVDAYKRAIYEKNATEARLYTNAAMAFIALERYEEAIVYCAMAQQIDLAWTKSLELAAVAYAHLGYDNLALDSYVRVIRDVSNDRHHPAEVAKRVLAIKTSISPEKRRQVDSDDLQRTIKRIIGVGNLDNQPNAESTLLFLLYHLNHHRDYASESRSLFDAGLMRLFRQVPVIKRLFSPSVDYCSLTPFECGVIERMLVLVAAVTPKNTEKGDLAHKALREIITLPHFMEFLCTLGTQMAKRNGIKMAATSPSHSFVLSKFISLLIPFDDSPAIRCRFVKGQPPLNDPTWSVYIWLACFCAFDPSTPRFFDFKVTLARLGNMTDEESAWFLDPWRNAPTPDLENAVALAVNLSTLLYWHEPVAYNPTFSPMLFWKVATQDPTVASVCLKRCGYVTHLMNRFVIAAEFLTQCDRQVSYRSEMLRIIACIYNAMIPLLAEDSVDKDLPDVWEEQACGEDAIEWLVKMLDAKRRFPTIDRHFAGELEKGAKVALMGFYSFSKEYAEVIKSLMPNPRKALGLKG